MKVETPEMTNQKQGRPCKYVTQEQFEKFMNNHFYHLNRDVQWIMWIGGAMGIAILGMVLAMFQTLVSG